jgi:hypothetical protein
MEWVLSQRDEHSRQEKFIDAAIQICLTRKVLSSRLLHQTIGFVQSLLRLDGMDREASDFSSLCIRQKNLNVSLRYHGSKVPLNLLIDNTGIKGEAE